MRERIKYDNDTGGSIVSWLRYEYEGLNLLRIDQKYDSDQDEVLEGSDSWRPMNIYLHGPGAIGQIIKSKWFSYADDSTATPCTTGEYYYFYDAVGNVVGVWDQRDGAYQSWAMDAFGNPLSGVEFLAMDQPGPKEHLTGKMFDTVTGLYYFMARWYDPEVGRFVSKDPNKRGVSGCGRNSVVQASPEAYAFSLANPIAYVDVNGMQPADPQPQLDLGQLESLVDELVDAGACNLCPGDRCAAFHQYYAMYRDGGGPFITGIQGDRMVHFFAGAYCASCSTGFFYGLDIPFLSDMSHMMAGYVCNELFHEFWHPSEDRIYDNWAAGAGFSASNCSLGINPLIWFSKETRRNQCKECLIERMTRLHYYWYTRPAEP